MKWALGLILFVGGGAAVLAFVVLDGASAALFTFATLVVIMLGAAPVLFGVLTRRAAERARHRPGPTVVSTRREDGEGTVTAETAAQPRRGRSREHRRPRG